MNSKTIVCALLAVSAPVTTVFAADGDWQIGVRTGIMLSSGKPANDMPYTGLSAKYRLRDSAYIGASIDRLSFDFERPWRVVGVEQDKSVNPKDIDAKARSTLFRVFYEREYGKPDQRWNRYWNAGIGLASVKADRITGPAAGGGTFNIDTDGGTEIVPSLGGGIRYNLTRQLSADAGLSLNYHLADWKVRDSVSGRTASVKSYASYGFQFGLSYRF